ncbi:MAG: hypothetical protein EBZ48_14355 [Proteobacteria bacterium]|nr:hypothetical protein [Pseudomonadota bacterium]
MNQPNLDLDISHRILNYLQALGHGEVYFLETLKELGSPEVTPEGIARARETLAAILSDYNSLARGVYLFSAGWESPQTYDAQRILRVLEDFLQRSTILFSRSRAIPAAFEGMVREQSRFAFSVIRRGLVAENFYVQGLYDLAGLRGEQEAIARAEQQARESMRRLEHFDRYNYAAMLQKELSEEHEAILGDLWKQQRLLLASQRVDIIELLSTFKGGGAYLEKELSFPALPEWQRFGFSVTQAARWSAFDFTLHDAAQWRTIGIQTPTEAYSWMREGFYPEETGAWIPLGQTPDACAAWKRANFTPDLALSFIQRGYMRPEDIEPEQG